MMFKYPLFLGIYLHSFALFSQQNSSEFGIEQTVHFGSILPHRPLVNEVIEGHSFIYELSFYKNTNGNKAWQQLFNYPKIGMSAMLLNLGNEKELGDAYGIFPYIQFPLSKKKIRWELRFGYGLGYIEKPFNRVTNFKNIVIGSKYNALINFNSVWTTKVTPDLGLSGGISLVHFSNGSFARPNLGINIFSFNLGFSYNFGEVKEQVVEPFEPREKKWEKLIAFNTGVKEIDPVDGPKYMVYTTSFSLKRPFSNKSSYGFSADLFYNTSLEQLISDDENKSTSKSDNIRAGLAVFYSLDVGNISYIVQMGGYVRTAFDGDGFIYHRVTTRYFITKHLFFNLGLKSHWAVADFVEGGIGLRL